MCADTLIRIRTCFIRQDEKDIKKERFYSTGGELLIRRSTASNELVGFELTFERQDGRGLDYVSWRKGHSPKTGFMESGDRAAKAKMSSTINLHATPNLHILRRAAAFAADHRRKLPDELRQFLAERLAPPPGRGVSNPS
jgi:hypothetical protein